jgi:predicted NBD/HSP70 family sugar kinase
VASIKPTLELLSSLSDEHVLRALMRVPQATRAELAGQTGLSKPTVGESVRRLVEGGSVVDTGERTSGPGRIGTYYALAPTAGRALAVSLAPEGIFAEAVDSHGERVARARAYISRSPGAERVADVLRGVARKCGGPFRLAVVSVADPVDRATGRVVELPDLPFVLGALDPAAALAGLIDGPVMVDNDVNWAARAEHRYGHAAGVDDFVYLYLGEGVGCAVFNDGDIRRGHTGLVGEIAYVLTSGPGGTAMRLIDVFGELGLYRPGTTAIDALALLEAERAPLARALAGAMAAVIAFADPALVIVGGPWGPALLDPLTREFAGAPRFVPLVEAAVKDEPSLTAAREAALYGLREAIVAKATR